MSSTSSARWKATWSLMVFVAGSAARASCPAPGFGTAIVAHSVATNHEPGKDKLMNDVTSKHLGELRRYCAGLVPGPLFDTSELERLLSACWDAFVGDDGGMTCKK